MHERPVKAEKDENCTHPATALLQQDQLFLQMIDVICYCALKRPNIIAVV